MAIAEIKVNVTAKIKWWVKPLFSIAGLACSLGIPVSVDRLREFVTVYGVSVSVDGRKA